MQSKYIYIFYVFLYIMYVYVYNAYGECAYNSIYTKYIKIALALFLARSRTQLATCFLSYD